MKNSKKAIFFAGTNGSGKSTLFQLKKNEYLGVRLNSDEIVKKNNLDWRDFSAQINAGKEIVKLQNKCLEEGISFNRETTLAGNSVIKDLKRAKEKGFFVEMFYIGVESPEINIARVKQRVARGGHGIPEEKIRRRYIQSMENLKKAIPYCDKISIYDNSIKFQKICKIANGKIEMEQNCNWVDEIFFQNNISSALKEMKATPKKFHKTKIDDKSNILE